MKPSLFVLLFCSLLIVTKFATASYTPDSTIAKRLSLLEQKIATQQKEINALKATNNKETVFTIDRKGGKQWVKKVN